MSRRVALWATAALLAFAPGAWRTWREPAPGEGREFAIRSGSSVVRPLARLASHVQWIRFQRARLAGRGAEALRLGASAVELAPQTTEGWEYLASHFGFYLASREREPDPARRRAWLEAALEVTERGSTRVADPGQLALLRGSLLLSKAELDPEIWSGGQEVLLQLAEKAFREAHELGRPEARDFLDYFAPEDPAPPERE